MLYRQLSLQVNESTQLAWWRTADFKDLLFIAYGLLVLLAVFASYLLGVMHWLPQDPDEIDMGAIMAGPLSSGHLLGTDFLGRDILTRLVLGIQAYFLPGLLAIGIALGLGAVAGVLAGYRGGRAAAVVLYGSNLLDSFPRLILVLLVIAAFKADIYYVMVVVGITAAPLVASLVKGKVHALQQKNFIESAVALGIPASTIIFKHILWYNCRSLLLIQATLGMAEAILIETSLSYLGFGVQEPTPSWGNMVQAGANYLLQGNFWPSTAPALAILATVLGFYLLGDGLNNILERRR